MQLRSLKNGLSRIAGRYDAARRFDSDYLFRKRAEYVPFCQGIQGFSPVDAHVTPIPDDMPGYADKIIMAAGDFVQGSSIELSADGPIRNPYMIYLQGGIVFEHNVLAILSAAQYIAEHREGAAHD